MSAPGQQIAVIAERTGSAMAVGGSFVSWLTQYQAAIAAGCALIGAVVAVLGFALHWWYLHRGSVEQRRREDD